MFRLPELESAPRPCPAIGSKLNSELTRKVLCFGAYHLDFDLHQLTKYGNKIRLPEQSFKILAMLIAAPGRLVSREELQVELWPANTFVDFERGLTVAVNRLRCLLADSPENPRFIETIPRLGYRFVASVEVISDGTLLLMRPGQPVPEPSASLNVAHAFSSPPLNILSKSPRMKPSRSLAYVFSGIASLLFLAIALAVVWPRFTHSYSSAAVPVRMLILPFQNLTGDASQEFLCDGMTEELISQLGGLDPDGLSVLARTTAMHYKGSSKTIKQITREVGADYVLEGSIRRVDNHIRVTTQLIQGPQERHLWAQSFDRGSSDILGLQQSVSLAVANEVPFRLRKLSDTHLRDTQPGNPAAYADYLRGRFFWNKRNRDGLDKGVFYFRQAIKEDGKYAVAYAGLADSYLVLGGGYLPPHQTYLQGEAAAADALALDGNLAEAHTSLAFFKFIDEWDWSGADREFRRAITLDPGYATAHHWYALYLSAMGRMPESINEIQKALELDPLSLVINSNAGAIYYQAGDYQRSEKQLRRTLELDPNFVPAYGYLGYVYQVTGRYGDALAEYRRAQEISGDPLSYGGDVGRIYGLTGRKREAQVILRQLQERAQRQSDMSAYAVCLIYTALGNSKEALKWLAKAVDERDFTATEMTHDLRIETLRSTPQFDTFRRQFKLTN
jgi:TolB-like protein/DNA-binding winged helix-turn-helix (wHTH) protein/tetratricopeptide (TPR) repeat protein